MATEKFSQEDFEKAIPSFAVCKGIVDGEIVYRWQISSIAAIKIRSSIDESGFAADTGEDSIRVWLVNNEDKPIASKVKAYTKRVKGWEERLYLTFEKVAVYHKRAGVCPVCGKAFGIFLSSKTNALYSRCWTCDKWGGKVPGEITESEKIWFKDLFENGFSVNSTTPAKVEENIDDILESGGDFAKSPISDASTLDFLGEDVAPYIDKETTLDLSKLDKFQAEVVKNLGNGPCVVEACPGCITGDTIIGLSRGRKSFSYTVENLYKQTHGIYEYKGIREWNKNIPTFIRARTDDGMIRLVPFDSIVFSGKKPVWLLETSSGHTIKATLEHLFLTQRGWLPLSKICAADQVFVESNETPINENAIKKSKKNYYYQLQNLRFHPFAGRKESVSVHRLVMEAHLNNMSFEEFLFWCRTNKGVSPSLFLDPSKTIVHHKNNDTEDFRIDNLEIMDIDKHAFYHGINGGWKHVTLRTRPDTVVSISYIGIESTYDITVNHDAHNFIANGIVVHNSGKTYTLENLIAAMLESGIDASRIGAFTFSRKAAEEMRRRISKTIWNDISDVDLDYLTNLNNTDHGSQLARRNWIEDDPRRVFIADWVCTIHALAFRLLKRAGYKFNVLSGRDEMEVKELIKDTLLELNWEESPKSIRLWISHAILSLVEPNGSERWFANVLENMGGPIWTARNLEEVYSRYMTFLKSRNLLDFDLMQARVIWLIRNDPSFKKDIQEMFDYILVDEAQDTSPIQTEILFTLAERSRNIMLVGDVDQAMYGFRGAVPEVLRDDFKSYWGETNRFVLPTNYRSTQSIILSASDLIAQNYRNDGNEYMKPFGWRDGAEVGSPVSKAIFEEFDQLSQETVEVILESGNPGGWFVLSRTRAECAEIHTRLIEAGIPAINKVSGLLFGAPHIKKVLAYARLACDYQDSRNNLEILKEIANVATIHFKAPMTRRRHLDGCHSKPWENCGCPILIEEGIDYSHARFYGQKSIEKAGSWNGVVGQQYDVNRGGYPTLEAKGSRDLVYFVNRLEGVKDDALATLNVIISDCVLPWLAAEEGITDEDLAENGKSEEFSVLTGMVKIGESTEEFLSRMDNISSKNGQKEEESVLVGTFHWSKGAERPFVVVNLTRCPVVPPKQEPGKLPVGSHVDINEERRLAFVGITRAKDRVYVFASQEWDGKEMPVSEFMSEVK